jgi:hypothetical protein
VFAGLDFGRHANPTGNLEQVTCPCRNADRVHGRLAVSHLTQRWLDTDSRPIKQERHLGSRPDFCASLDPGDPRQ